MIELLYHNQKGDKQIDADKEWKKQLKFQDIRDVVLKKLTGRNYSDVGIMVYFLKLGTYFCVFKEFPSDRALDNHAIWIFVPKDVEVNPKELHKLLAQVIEKVKCEPPYEEDAIKAFSTEVEKLGRDCSVKPCKRPEFLSTDNKKIACWYYNEEDSLYDLLCNLYQPVYERYEAVLFLDKKSGLRGGQEVDDLTNQGLIGQEVIEPSEINNQLSSGIEVYYNGRPLNEPIFISKKGHVDLEFRKRGFVPIPYQYAKGQSIDALEWKVRVDHDLFSVTNKDKRVTGFALKINGLPIYSSIDLTEMEAKNVSFQIEKGGFEPCPYKKDNVNLLDFILNNRKIPVQLKKSDQEFDVIQNKYERVKVVITTSKTIEDDMSPIAGYLREGDALEYDSWAFLNHLLFWLLMAGALILGGVGGYLVSNWINSRSAKQNTTVTTQTTPNQNGEKVQQLSPSDGGASTGAAETVTAPEKPVQNVAVEYLDNHDVWNKDEMDNIPELKGFWDLVNYYDIDRIKKQPWEDRLSESKTYNEIINTFRNKKTSDFRTNKPHNKRTDDYDINVEGYIKAIKGYSGNSNAQPQAGSSTPKKEHPTTTTTNSTNNQSTNQSAGTNEDNL